MSCVKNSESFSNAEKIYIGPTEVAGFYRNLTLGMRECGFDCDFITFDEHPFQYGGESYVPILINVSQWLTRFSRKRSSLFLKALVGGVVEILNICWGVYAIFKYDVFIFSFGRSFSRLNLDLFLIKILRKKIIANVFHGSEARPPYINGANQDYNGGEPSIYYLRFLAWYISFRIRVIEKCATVIVGSPFSSSQYLSGRFVNYFFLGLPNSHCDDVGENSDFISKGFVGERSAVRILHSPSHPAAKGTPKILEAINNLRGKGYSIEFELIHGCSHDEVIREIKKCDFVVDQVYSDTPMAGFAAEAGWYGKPAIVCGYGFDYLKQFVPKMVYPPSKASKPDELERVMEYMIVDSLAREFLGRRAQRFVREKWGSKVVAERYIRIINEEIPGSWWIESESVNYLYGIGQSKGKSKETIRRLVAKFGVKSLMLSHRPKLEAELLEFAGIES